MNVNIWKLKSVILFFIRPAFFSVPEKLAVLLPAAVSASNLFQSVTLTAAEFSEPNRPPAAPKIKFCIHASKLKIPVYYEGTIVYNSWKI